MKTFCRILSCVLVALMVLSFVACGSETTSGKTTETNTPATGETGEPSQPATESGVETGETTPVSDKPVIKERFDGAEIKFFINGGESTSVNSRSIALVANDEGETPDMGYEVNQKVQQRNDTVESELGVKIVLKDIGGMQDTVGTLTPILSTGEYVYDVIGLYQYFDLGLALGDTVGSFFNYQNMPEGVKNYIDVKAPYWNQALYNTLMYKDVSFFITGDLCQGTSSTMFVSYVNAKMWAQYASEIAKLETSGGYSDIYELVNNGYWTLDLWTDLANLCYIDTNSNEKIDHEDQLGLINYTQTLDNIMMDGFVAGSHFIYSELDEDGEPYMTYNSEHNLKFLNKIYTLLCESKAGAVSESAVLADYEYIMEVFAKGNVLLTVNTLQCAEDYLPEMTDDFYVMPLPMLDRDQFDATSPSKGYTTQLGDSVSQYAVCVAAGVERIPQITATLELMGYYSKLWVTPAYYDTALKSRYTRDLKAGAMIDMIHNGIYADFAQVWSGSLGHVTWHLRQNYNQHSNVVAQSRTTNGKFNVNLQKLLPAIEEAFYVQAY